MVVGLLGILKAGGPYVPLDPAYPQERLSFMLSDSQAKVLLTQQRLLERLPEHQAYVICLDTDWETINQQSKENPVSSTTSRDLAYVIYTSGSTGKPKGVQILHGAVVNFLKSMEREPGLTKSDVLLAITTLSFDIAALELYLPLIVGALLVLVSREVATDGKQLMEQLRASGATVMQATPATWHMLLVAGWQGSSQLKILCGGEALPRDLAEQLLEKGASLWNLYGPTETTIWSTVFKVESSKLSNASVPSGCPIANTQIYLLDSQGQPVPVGIPGELHIGGTGLARGYLNRPELTAQKFILNPFKREKSNSERLYKTGDLARYLPDGTIEYLGRSDYQVKIRGFRIELGEIETVLSQHPAVQQAVVIAREDEPGNKRLVAYLVVQASSDDITQELRSLLQEKLPNPMVPSFFVQLEALPLTPNGKVDRRSLPVPDATTYGLERAVVPPRNPIEDVLVGIWTQVLGVEKVGIYDNFFELGGHSLLATQVMSHVGKAFEVELPLRRLFESPTVAGLTEAIQNARNAEPGRNAPPIDRISRNGNLPLSFAQERLWLLEQLQPGSLAYHTPAAIRLVGSLDRAALEQALNEILRRHEVFRTTFTVVDGQPVQAIAPFQSVSLPVMNLGELSEAERSPKVQQLVTQWGQQLFDLAQDSLLRWMLLRIGEQENLLLLSTHHIVCDGWSAGVFVRELATLYDAFSQGQPSPLPELPIQYADFALSQRQWLQGDVLKTQLEYWKQQLGTGACFQTSPSDLDPPKLELKRGTLTEFSPLVSNVPPYQGGIRGVGGWGGSKGLKTDPSPPVLKLPTERSSSSTQSATGRKQCFALSPTLTEALNALSQREGVTLFMTLLAGFKALLYRYSTQDDIVVGSPIANRIRTEIEGLIGFFANTLVLRTDLSGNPSFRDVLRRVREVALGAYAHQDLPFEKLVAQLQPDRNLGQTPLYQVWFVLQNAPMPAVELPSLTLSFSQIDTGAVRHDLKLDLTETPKGLQGFFEYKTDLFETSIIARMTQLYETLLDTVIKQPDIELNALVRVLENIEKQQQLVQEAEFKTARRQKLGSIRRKQVKS
jgi:amino acid adenylation domain-containing protein